MILESKYWQWKKEESVAFKIILDKKTCTVDFEKMIVESTDAVGNLVAISIKRTEKNIRNRPNAEERYQGSD